MLTFKYTTKKKKKQSLHVVHIQTKNKLVIEVNQEHS